MKKLLLALTIATMSINAYAENVSFDGDTGIVHIPIVDFQGLPAFSDVELRFRKDGLFELINLSEYIPIPSFQLNDSGSHSNQRSQYTISHTGGIHRASVEGREITLIITGLNEGYVERYMSQSSGQYYFTLTFKLTPSGFPDPNEGEKGQYYATSPNGNIAYADIIDQNTYEPHAPVEKIVEDPLEKIVCEDKIVYQDKIVEKVVYVDKIIEVEVPAEWPELEAGATEKVAFTDSILLEGHGVGDVFHRANDELWIIKGMTDIIGITVGENCTYGFGASASCESAENITFYYSFNSLPAPESGVKSNYYFWRGKHIIYVDAL